MSRDLFAEVGAILTEMGGPGSGHFRHAGRKGKRGGSVPSKSGGVGWEEGLRSRGHSPEEHKKWAQMYAVRPESKSFPRDYDPEWGFTPGTYTAYRGQKQGAELRSTERGIYFSADAAGASPYGRGTAVAYRVTTKNPFVTTDKSELTKDIYGKTFRDTLEGIISHEDVDSVVANRIIDARIAKYLRGKGYDALVLTRPAPPATREMAVWNTSQVEVKKVTKSDFIISQIESQLVLSPEGGWVEKGGPGSGHFGHKGRKGKRGGSAPSSAHKGRFVPVVEGRQDRRTGHEYAFESKVVDPLTQADRSIVLGWRLADMERGPKGFAEEQGLGAARARRLTTWARDSGLVEKVGSSYMLTPLGKTVAEKPSMEWFDHVALMTGDQSMMTVIAPKPDAIAYWLYANYPKGVSTVSRGEIERAWYKSTGDRWGRFTDKLPVLESGLKLKTGRPAAQWARIADLDWVAVDRGTNREDFV